MPAARITEISNHDRPSDDWLRGYIHQGPMTFREFRDGEGGRILGLMGYNIRNLTDWAEYARALCAEDLEGGRPVTLAATRLRNYGSPIDGILVEAAMVAARISEGHGLADEAKVMPAGVARIVAGCLNLVN